MTWTPSTSEGFLHPEQSGGLTEGHMRQCGHLLCPHLTVSMVARRQVVSRAYVGCIKNVEIARSNFDLLKDAFGVRKGCVLKVCYLELD